MIEPSKIGIVYRDRVPEFLLEAPREGVPWTMESFPENSVLGGPTIPSRDYLAVFFPAENEAPEMQRQLSNLFPGAEIVGYRNSDRMACGSLSRDENGLLVVQVPMPLYLVRHLLDSFSSTRAQRRELSCIQERVNGVQDFFNAFVNTVDSSSNISDRNLGMSQLIN